jgi:hypothetical protein
MDPNEYEGWTEKDSMVSGGMAPDNWVGEFFSRRFQHPRKPGCLIDVSISAATYENDAVEGGHELGIEEEFEYRICRNVEDPGSTEEWSGLQYTQVGDYTTFKSVEEAAIYAKQRLKDLDAGDLSWNGVRF